MPKGADDRLLTQSVECTRSLMFELRLLRRTFKGGQRKCNIGHEKNFRAEPCYHLHTCVAPPHWVAFVPFCTAECEFVLFVPIQNIVESASCMFSIQ